MTHRTFLIAVAAVCALSCARAVTERVPSGGAPEPDDLNVAYLRELAQLVIPSGLERDHLRSPDGEFTLALTHDESLTGQQTGFYGVELVEQRSGRRRPILSLWEADAGSGILLNVRWSSDSRAVRLSGATKGFRRQHREFVTFNLVYVIDSDRFVDLMAPEPSGERSSQHAI